MKTPALGPFDSRIIPLGGKKACKNQSINQLHVLRILGFRFGEGYSQTLTFDHMQFSEMRLQRIKGFYVLSSGRTPVH